MSTDTTKTEAKYTLITYRPNGRRYEGCGDYEYFDSEMGIAKDLTREQLIAKISEKHAASDNCCTSCDDGNPNPTEFAILKDGRPVGGRGDSLMDFRPDDEDADARDADAIFDAADELRGKIRNEKAEAERKAKEAAALKAAEAKKAAEAAARVAAEAKERAEYERLRAKFEQRAEAQV